MREVSFGLVLLAAFIISVSAGASISKILIVDVYYNTQAVNCPAAMYEVGEIINDEYRVYATDNSHTLWITDFEGCTYKAEVSFEKYSQLSYWEKVEVPPKKIAEFEITEISKSEMDCNNGGKDCYE